jgi:hypothetical protein
MFRSKESGSYSKDRPRFLTENEKKKVLSYLPDLKCISSESRRKEGEQFRELVSRSLSEHKICPSKVPYLVKEIVKLHYVAQADEGEAIGIAGSNALSATATQSVLNVFHKAGDIGVSGTEKMVKTLKAQKITKPRDMSTKIYFNHHISEIDAKEMKILLEQATINNLLSPIKKYEPIAYTDEWVKNNQWYKYYNIPKVDNLLRVYFNPVSMYRHKLTMTDILVTLLRKSFSRKIIKEDIDLKDYITIVPSPTHLFFLDFFFKWDPNQTEEEEYPLLDTYMNEDFIYHKVIIDSFDTTIKGVTGCEDIRVNKHAIEKYIIKEMELSKEMKEKYGNNAKSIFLNKKLFHTTPLDRKTFGNILEKANIEIIEKIDDTWIVYSNEGDQRKISIILSKMKDFDPTVYYLLSTGDNVMDILRYPGISHRYTTSDNLHTNLKVYGIGNARHTLIDNIRILSSDSAIVHPAYSTMISSMMTITGSITGCTSNGLDKIGQSGPMERACYEKAMLYLKASAFMGNEFEATNTVTTNLLNGQRVKTGTGLHYVAMKTPNKVYIDSDVYNLNIKEVKRYLTIKRGEEEEDERKKKRNRRRKESEDIDEEEPLIVIPEKKFRKKENTKKALRNEGFTEKLGKAMKGDEIEEEKREYRSLRKKSSDETTNDSEEESTVKKVSPVRRVSRRRRKSSIEEQSSENEDSSSIELIPRKSQRKEVNNATATTNEDFIEKFKKNVG